MVIIASYLLNTKDNASCPEVDFQNGLQRDACMEQKRGMHAAEAHVFILLRKEI